MHETALQKSIGGDHLSIFPENGAVVEQGRALRAYMGSLFRHLRLFLWAFSAVMIVAILATILPAKQYQSETKILLVNNRSNTVITPDRNTTTTIPPITEQELNSELEILGGDDVVSSVADPGWSKLGPSLRVGDRLKLHSDLLRLFRKHLRIEPTRKSNIITVTYTAESPEAASHLLRAFSDAYLAQRKTLSLPTGTSAFFHEEADRYRSLWQKANNDLADFQRTHQLVSVPQRLDQLSRDIASDEDDLRDNRAELVEVDGRLRASSDSAKTIPERQRTVTRDQTGQASTEALRALLVQLQNRKTELLSRYQASDTLVEDADNQIATTTASLNDLLAQKGTEETTDINPPWQQVQSSLVSDRIQGNALRAKARGLSSNIRNLRGELKNTEALQVQFNTLEEAADQARSNFEFYSEKRDQTQIEDAMDDRKIVNVGIAESPTWSFQPAFPKPILNIALGLLTALFLSFGAVYLAESSRDTFATPQELELYSRRVVLATIPLQFQLADENERPKLPGFPSFLRRLSGKGNSAAPGRRSWKPRRWPTEVA